MSMQSGQTTLVDNNDQFDVTTNEKLGGGLLSATIM
jgi:hypothetical protein